MEKLFGVVVSEGLDHERDGSPEEGRRGSATPPLHGRENIVQSLARAQGRRCFRVIRLVVATDVGGFALNGEHFSDDLFFAGGEAFRNGLEDRL